MGKLLHVSSPGRLHAKTMTFNAGTGLTAESQKHTVSLSLADSHTLKSRDDPVLFCDSGVV